VKVSSAVALLLWCMLSGGCATAAQPQAADNVETVTGVVVVSGTAMEPMPTILPEGGTAIRLEGPLAAELRTLAGATVIAHGATSGEGLRRSMDVASYEITEIHGVRPLAGVVLADGRLVAGADTLTLTGAGAALRPGFRIWVTGERAGREVRVSSWGRIGGS
jgi:hypothetical protein